jgi:Tol biopolymer transport system component
MRVVPTAPADCIGSPRVAPDGQRVAFVACKEDQPAIVVVDRERKVELRAVTLGGKERVLARVPGTIEDVARDGRVLVSRGASIWGVRGVAPGESQERELSWLEGSAAVDPRRTGGSCCSERRSKAAA